MNSREKILAAVVLALVATWVGSRWYGDYQRALSARRTALLDAQARLAEVNLALSQGRSAIQKLEAWQARSLPANRERALSLYKAWLLAKAKDAGLTVEDIKPSARIAASPAYNTVGYQIDAAGPLSAVTAMLYKFYSTPLLHQITRLHLSRPAGETNLRVALEVEALSLPGAIAADGVPQGKSHRLRLASLEAYQKSLGERDLVSVYAPRAVAAVPTAAPDAKSDDRLSARFSATVPGSKGLQAWINVPATGETLHVSAGDPLKVAGLDGKIISVEPRSLVLQSGDKKFRVALGQSLHSGKEIEPNGGASNEPPIGERRGSSPPG
jgi:hypothetical protein